MANVTSTPICNCQNGREWVELGEIFDIMEESERHPDTKQTSREDDWWEKVKYFTEHKEFKEWSKVFRKVKNFNGRYADPIEQGITISVAAGLILTLIYLNDKGIIDNSSFGVMFGTVFGYLLSWRFGK